ncbi:ATP-binding cassette domain-containing protein [Weissella confusa]|nr:ATP-binding cassette domain-containing protein [Weissella confusa]
MADPMIDIKNLGVTVRNKHHENKPILQGVNLTLTRNTVLGLVGESGSGKTMTMRALLGLLPGEAIVSADAWQVNGVAYPVR